MSSLTTLDKKVLSDLLDMSSGYVVHKNAFTNATFAELIRGCVNADIYDDKYAFDGNSKAKRLRAFWELHNDQQVGKVLAAILDAWIYEFPSPDMQSKGRYDQALGIVNRLLGKSVTVEENEDTFLKQQFAQLDMSKIGLDNPLLEIAQSRLLEAHRCLKADAPLAVIFLSGSILEGILLDVASKHPRDFNHAASAPKDKDEKVKPLHSWTLAQLINAAHDTEFLKLDVKKFSHELRDFRNYIHPRQQAVSGFSPTKHTAEICMQVLKAAIADLSGGR
jgi:hypothetical protein